MLSEFFLNATILISFFNLSSHFFRSDFTRQNSLLARVMAGIISGLLGLMLMIYSVKITPGVIMDFRHIAIIQSAMTAGPVGALISGCIIAIFRLTYSGISFQSSISALGIIMMSLGSALIAWRWHNTLKGWIIGSFFVTFVGSLSITLLISVHSLLPVLSAYWLGTLPVAILVFVYVEYLNRNEQRYRQYKAESTKDFLTGLCNVREFDQKFNELKDRHEKDPSPVSLLFLDIDYFKKINDTYGHINGDLVLEQLAQVLETACRSSDLTFRKGGEEFAIILYNSLPEQAFEIAERIRKTVSDHSFRLNKGQKTTITVSIGIASYPQPVAEITNILELADSALYTAKHSGRNRVISASRTLPTVT